MEIELNDRDTELVIAAAKERGITPTEFVNELVMTHLPALPGESSSTRPA